MGLNLGSGEITKMYLGSGEISKAYLGSNLIFNNTGVAFTTEYQNIIDEATTQGYTLPTTSEQNDQNAKIQALKDNSLWSQIDAMWYFKGDGDKDFKSINWKNPTGDKAFESVTDTMTFNSDGIRGDATNYYTLPYNPTDDGTNYTLNDASVIFDVTGSGITDATLLEMLIGAGRATQIRNSSTIHYINSNGTLSRSITDFSGEGFFIYEIVDGTIYASKDGSIIDTEGGKTPDSVPSTDVNLFKIGSTGRGDVRLGGVMFGKGLTGDTSTHSNYYDSYFATA